MFLKSVLLGLRRRIGEPIMILLWEKIGDGENSTSFGIADGTAKAGDVITVDALGRGGFVFRLEKQ